jgi:hypothetical protein
MTKLNQANRIGHRPNGQELLFLRYADPADFIWSQPVATGRCTAVAGSPRRRCTPDGFGVRYPILEREPHKRRDLDAVELTAVASHDDLVGLIVPAWTRRLRRAKRYSRRRTRLSRSSVSLACQRLRAHFETGGALLNSTNNWGRLSTCRASSLPTPCASISRNEQDGAALGADDPRRLDSLARVFNAARTWQDGQVVLEGDDSLQLARPAAQSA